MAPEESQVLVVGYGTLLHRPSLGHVLGDREGSTRQFEPVIVPGFQRLFNLLPEHYEPSDVVDSPALESGAMNVRPTPDPAAGHWLNAVVFAVDRPELARLDRREYCYRRLEVPVLRFADRAPLGTAMIYSCADGEPWIRSDPAELLPLWRDLDWARRGSYAFGGEFGRAYDETTYLADGVTLAAEFYADLLPDLPAGET